MLELLPKVIHTYISPLQIPLTPAFMIVFIWTRRLWTPPSTFPCHLRTALNQSDNGISVWVYPGTFAVHVWPRSLSLFTSVLRTLAVSIMSHIFHSDLILTDRKIKYVVHVNSKWFSACFISPLGLIFDNLVICFCLPRSYLLCVNVLNM